jgi:hypothetical protein
MFFTNTDPRTRLQRRLDADAKRSSCCRTGSDAEAAEASACPSETEEATVADRPLFARPRPQDGSGPEGLRLRPDTCDTSGA